MKRIVILASGSGTNALNMIRYFKKTGNAEVVLVISNKGDAGVLEKAALENVSVMLLKGKEHFQDKKFSEFLVKQKVDLIVLAGFLLLIPGHLIKAFPDKIINIHPALLPKHGGKECSE